MGKSITVNDRGLRLGCMAARLSLQITQLDGANMTTCFKDGSGLSCINCMIVALHIISVYIYTVYSISIN